MKQATYLTAKETFSFKVNGKGRAVTFKQGQRFWVTSTENSQFISVARLDQPLGSGYEFSPEQVSKFFSVEE